ncbi:MAG: hypothetical protein ACPGU7_04755 [Gammaproteobacteria bacterium]
MNYDEELQIPWRGVRRDLLVHEGPLDPDGQQTWVVEDPLRGASYRLGFAEAALFQCLATSRDLASAVNRFYRSTALRPMPQQIIEFVTMLQDQNLARLPPEAAIEKAENDTTPTSESFFKRLLHGYVYFRVPLLRPDAFLTALYPWVAWLASPWMNWLYLVLGVAGLMLTLPQLELFLSTASFLFTPQGAAFFGVSLVLLKIGHEFAHGLTAKSLGLHVRTMGIAFLVMWPILFTDASDSWRLDDRKKRLAIDVAGMRFELVVAAIALFLWAVLPDGIMRSLMFFLAGTSLASSLMVNFNPFMSFDGYYALMDMWGVDNLRPRAYALWKHRMRRMLWDWQGRKPEDHPHEGRLIAYATGATLYRIMIALTIAFAVYHLFFKALGLTLLAVELWIFAVRPVWMEVSYVIKNRKLMGSPVRIALTLALIGGFITLLAYPMPKVERLPAVVQYDGASQVLAPVRGVIDVLPPEVGERVAAGDLLAHVTDPAREHELKSLQYELEQSRARLAVTASGGEQGGYRRWLLAEQARLEAEVAKVREQVALEEIRAPRDGTVMWRNNDIEAGSAIAKDTLLVVLARSERREIWAYVNERIVERVEDDLEKGGEVHFANLETEPLSVSLVEKGRYPVQSLANEALYDVYGGPVVSIERDGNPIPREAHYRMVFALPDAPTYLRHGVPARVWVQGQPQSILDGFTDFIGRVLAEEGFI